MALDQSALLELLAQLKLTDVTDRAGSFASVTILRKVLWTLQYNRRVPASERNTAGH
jgi:hypothetical protein